MKLSKVLFGSAVALSLIFGCVSCADDDDTEGAITGRNNNYTVSYTNNGTETYYAYNGTNLQHSGGTFLLKMENQSASGSRDGTMGIMWDKHTNAAKDTEYAEGSMNFFVCGITYNLQTGKLGYYVSKFMNVTNIQAGNFGAKATNTGKDPQETSLSATSGTKDSAGFYYVDYTPVNGTVTVVVDVQPNDTDASSTDGGYTVTLYNSAEALDSINAGSFKVKETGADTYKIATFNISKSVTGYENSFKAQNDLAVYANIASGRTLNGTWTFGDIINKAVAVEE